MEFKELFKTIEKHRYYVFSHNDLLSFYPDEKKSCLKKAVYRWKRRGWISPLRRGVYELTYPKDFHIPDLYIANHMYGPSYISLETALSHYSIIPEVSMTVTSVTTKPTRKFRNRHGLFIYRTVKPAAFAGYYIEKQGGFDVFIAEPEKALVDFLHFKTYRNKKFDYGDERLDRDALSRLKTKKIKTYAKPYGLDLKGLYAYL